MDDDKGSDKEAEVCAICFDPLSSSITCSLPNCPHSFHFECLKTYYEIDKNNWRCPQCRAAFNRVLVEGKGWIDAELNKPEASTSSDDEEEDDESVDDDTCYICGGYGT